MTPRTCSARPEPPTASQQACPVQGMQKPCSEPHQKATCGTAAASLEVELDTKQVHASGGDLAFVKMKIATLTFPPSTIPEIEVITPRLPTQTYQAVVLSFEKAHAAAPTRKKRDPLGSFSGGQLLSRSLGSVPRNPVDDLPRDAELGCSEGSKAEESLQPSRSA